ncbi:MAG TPA: hypothetical protein VKU01_31495 [Bryobacteraceae bacterium]|nr:hypothetical protein [Bryobacteraceae bacterium]
MSTFKFRLERVLRWRTLELTGEETKLKALVEEDIRLHAQLAEAKNNRAQIGARVAMMDNLNGFELNAVAGYAQHLTRECMALKTRCREHSQKLAAQAHRYQEAKKRCRLLEELKNRQHHDWQVQTGHELEELAQESYIARWNRQ